MIFYDKTLKIMSEEIKNNYDASSIQALEGMEHVRMRPSMYIGDVGSTEGSPFSLRGCR